MTNPLLDLAAHTRWVTWRLETRENGTVAKPPYSPVTGRMARPDSPTDWTTLDVARAARRQRDDAGVGIVLGELRDGTFLCGLDLDSCRDPATGAIAPWAADLIARFSTYAEVSPSGTGLKLFFRTAAADVPRVRAAMCAPHGRTWKQAGSGGGHPSAIELHLSNRYFTVTCNAVRHAPMSLAIVPADTLLNLIQRIGPAFSGRHVFHALAGTQRKGDGVANCAAPNPPPLDSADADDPFALPFPPFPPYDPFALDPEAAEDVPAPPGAVTVLEHFDAGAMAVYPGLREHIAALAATDPKFRHRACGGTAGLNDKSRSGRDQSMGAMLRKSGLDLVAMREALAAWTHGAGAEKAADGDERYFGRIWDKASAAAVPDASGLPHGYLRREDNIWFVPSDDAKGTHVCGPLDVEAVTDDGDGGRAWGRLLHWKDQAGRVHRLALSMGRLLSDASSVRTELAQRGLFVASTPRALQLLSDLLQRWMPNRRVTIATQPGWNPTGGFVLPAGSVVPAGCDEIMLQADRPDALPPAAARGNLDGWRERVAGPAGGHSRMVLTLCAAFAAPLLDPLRAEGGGFHLHGESSTGKTTAALVAVSVWGSPAWKLPWRTTDNSLEAVAAMHNHLPLVLDEISQVEPAALDAASYMLANGQGKGRADRTGAAREVRRWLIHCLSTGEVPFGDRLAADPRQARRARAGQDVRLVDVPADAGAGAGIFDSIPPTGGEGMAKALQAAAAEQHGTAGPAFLRRLVDGRESAVAKAREVIAAFLREHVPTDAGGQVRRVADRFAVLAAAGELASAWGVVPWPAGTATKGVGQCFQAWLERRGGIGAGEHRRAVNQVRDFIGKHGESRFQRIGVAPDPFALDDTLSSFWVPGASNRVINQRAGWRRPGQNGADEYCFTPDGWKEATIGLDSGDAAKALDAAGYLIRGDGRNLQVRVSIPGMGRVRGYVVPGAILSGDA